ncbi:hypothetical protein FRC10_003500, partial [Ceratobasidium sp. 414]
MDSPSPRSRRPATAGRPASFARAAARLDDAAAKLSAAAEAMSAAAEIFASAFKLAPVGTSVAVVVEQPTQTLALDQDIAPGHITDEECTNPDESEYWLSDQEERAYADSKRGYTSLSSQHVPNLIPPKPEATYYKRVVCYMACGLNVLAIYKDLVESITGTAIYVVTKSSAGHTNSVASKFFEHENAILMLPETVSPDSQFGTSTDLCVIHVDWPSDEARYKKQIGVHRAQTNILVAFSEDSYLYPSGSNILAEATPWPTHEKSTQPTNALRLLFDQKLSDISAEKKESIYVDWISCHGQCGSRYVESWDATNLVHRANLYILDVLRYKNIESTSSNADLQVALPRVSPGFVAHNKLESAVEEGVLHVRYEGSSKSTFSATKDEILARGATSLNELNSSRRSDPIPPPDFWEGASGAHKSEHRTPKPVTPEVPEHLPGSAAGYWENVNMSPTPTFEPVPGHNYIAIREQFDAIPLICFLAGVHGRLVCFLDDESALVHYRSLLSAIVSHKIYYPGVVKDPNAVEDAAKSFISQSAPAMLLLSINTKNLPPALANTFVDCAVHWGSLHQALKHHKKMTYSSAYVILTAAHRDKRLEKGPMQIESHPSSELFLSQDEGSLLAPLRDITKSVLLSKRKLVQQMYR